MNLIKSTIPFVFLLYSPFLQADVSDYLNTIKKDPNALYAFFKVMPKGGELHYHLAGGAYPETMLKLAVNSNYCINKTTYAITKDDAHCDGIKSSDVLHDTAIYANIVKDWSMKDFVPGKETGQEHFFQGFMKYMPIIFDYRPQLLADIIKRASEQKELYLEIMDIPDNAQSLSFGNLLESSNTLAQKRNKLLANKEFQNNIINTVLESDRMLNQARDELACQSKPQSPACQVTVKLLYYVLREQPINNMFAQSLTAFEAVSRSKNNLIGVNLVQPEDGIISLRDYKKQMEVFQFLHQQYPQVHISLHAGELSPQRVVPEDLGFHIRDALLIGNATRIGHGVDIAYENNSNATLKHMATQQLPVEINLISNKIILNNSGKNHPLNYYLAHNVPVVLSSDDEGVLRTDLTRQYVEAVIEHGLNYQQIKHINRNALTYAFLPGTSIWMDAAKGILISQCKDLNSSSCSEFVKNSPKAALQRSLETELNKFEAAF